MIDRLTREKEYHNKAFSEGVRKPADKFYTIHSYSHKKLNLLLEKHGSGKKVLEYGCGTGHNSMYLASFASELTAIDISDYAIETAEKHARKLGLTNTRFLEMNAEELTFDDNSFDLIFGNAIIHHLDLHKSYKEIYRVLRPGGKAIFYEPLGHNFFINHYRKRTPQMRTEDEHPLLMADITLARQFFDNVSVKFYHLTTLMAVPFRNTIIFKPLLKLLCFTDRLIFGFMPFMRKNAWFCYLELSNKQ